MGVLLDKVIHGYATHFFQPEQPEQPELFSAEKALERDIVAEIIEEQASRIEKRAADKSRAAQIEKFALEIRALVTQCIVLALVVGVLSSHIFELISQACYYPNGVFDVKASLLGTLITILVCISVVLWLLFSRLAEIFKGFKSEGDGSS